MSFQRAYLHDLARTFRQYKRLGDGALAQVSDENLHTLVDPGANSIAIVMKHIAGNMRSRWTDFLTADGEKPDRDRDSEFVIEQADTKERLLSAGVEVVASSPAAFGAALKAEIAKWGKLIKQAGIKHE